jgi:hypothetical protein
MRWKAENLKLFMEQQQSSGGATAAAPAASGAVDKK